MIGVNSLPKTVTRQRCGCHLNPGPTAPESSTLTTRLPNHPNKLQAHLFTYLYLLTCVQIPLDGADGPDQTLSETRASDSGLRQVRRLSGRVRSGRVRAVDFGTYTAF